jgi:3D (Asp-Asp-Asp) domain-containing protein
MKFRRRVRNKRVIKVVVATLMAFLMVLTTGYAQPKKQIQPVSNVKAIKAVHGTKLKAKTSYHKKGNIYMTQGKRMQVGATAYCNDPITSTGTKPIVGRTIAVDPRIIPYGTKVYIPQFDRIFIAEDCGSAIKGNRIDIYMESEAQCREWGIKTIDIYILGK